jgi:SAM-dependent methyltransferase
MRDETSSQHFQLHRNILKELGFSLAPGAKVLDFGCGAGAMVAEYRSAGYEAFGCDIELAEQTDLLKRIDTGSYGLPFPEGSFDFVFSDQVFEHVKNLALAVGEIHRVMKPGAVSLHIFPARWKPVESHTFVPFAGRFQSYPWLLAWAFFGIRNSFQGGKSFREVAALNLAYLKNKTRYLSKQEIVNAVCACFDKLKFAEKEMLKHNYGSARYIYPLTRFSPAISWLYSTLYARVIFLQKAG